MKLELKSTNDEGRLVGIKRDGRSYSVREHRLSWFLPPEWIKLIDELPTERSKLTAECLINTGARINKCRGFILNPVFDNDRNNITLLHTKVRARLGKKTPRVRTIPVSKSFFNQLKKEIKERRVLSTNAFNTAVKIACAGSIINKPEQFSSHNLRKTFATWMLSLGVDGFRLAKHLGHTPNELARDYATNDVFNSNDKQIMRSILKDLPNRFFQDRRY